MKYIKDYAYAGYLGFALFEFADVTVIEWEFYAITVPLFALIGWKFWDKE